MRFIIQYILNYRKEKKKFIIKKSTSKNNEQPKDQKSNPNEVVDKNLFSFIYGKLLLMGRSGAGKTSMHSIIFANYPGLY